MAARGLLAAVAVAVLIVPATAAEPTPGECAGGGGREPVRCLYRSMLPSAGLVAECRSDADCRVGSYYGDPARASWLVPPAGLTALPRPEVIWRTATLAEARFRCGGPCTVSYFFEARRNRRSPPRWQVLDVDAGRLLLVAAEGEALVVRQVFSGRETARLDRPWAPHRFLVDVLTAVRLEPDGRLAFTWLPGGGRAPLSERVTVPSVPREPAAPRD